MSGRTVDQSKYLVKGGVITPSCSLLKSSDDRLVGVVLKALDAILKVDEDIKEEGYENFNPFTLLNTPL